MRVIPQLTPRLRPARSVSESRSPVRRSTRGPRFAGACAFGALLASVTPVSVAAADSTPLRVTGMTFVGSRGSTSELVVWASHALFYPDTSLAELEKVRAAVTDQEKGKSFEMKCDSAALNLETNDFSATGNVEGVTSGGQRYSAPWVQYVHEKAMLFSDAPVVLIDSSGILRGDGFRYHIEERRFELIGNVSVEQGS